jgi:hypothetical protein
MRPLQFGFREHFARLPTTDLYVLNPLAELRRQGAPVPAARHLSENVYLVGSTGVIVRYGRVDDIGRLRSAGARQIVYVVDDDFHAGAEDQALPEHYRQRLANFARAGWPALRAAADIVIVPGAVLADSYGARARIVPPAWHSQPASSQHHAAPKYVEIAHLGTGSHRADLDLVAAPLARILDERPEVRLTLFAGSSAPASLKSHRHVRLKRTLSWWRYKRVLPRQRFHLGLYPLAPTPFNSARSANKLFEHAIVGAASLMSPNPALRAAAGPDVVRFVEGGQDAWAEAIEAILAGPEDMRRQAEAARAHIHATNPLAYAALQWRDILQPKI